MENLCLTAFNEGNKAKALEYLKQCSNPSLICTDQANDTNGVLTIQNITLLHIAARHNWPDVISTLIQTYKCDKEAVNNRWSTPVHYCARYGSLEAMKCLVEKHGCDPMRQTKNLWTSLHWAASKGQVNILKYLISERKCDPSKCPLDKNGHSLLHLSCSGGHTEAAIYLLRTGLVDPSLTDAWSCTASEWARTTNANEVDTVKIMEYFEKCRIKCPIDTYTRVFVLGNKQAGKTTLVKVLKERSQMQQNCDADGNVEGTELHTVGMIPENIESKEIGNMIIYDLAGDPDYYYSHATVLENALQLASAMFVVVVDISQKPSVVSKQLYYWFSFIFNLNTMQHKVKLIIVGSHVDCLLKIKGSLQEISDEIRKVSQIYSRIIECTRFITMDCRKVNSSEICHFSQNLLINSLSILSQSINIDYTCHALCFLLKYKLNVFHCTLGALSKFIECNNEVNFLPTSHKILAQLLEILSKQGFIIFLKYVAIGNSWIVTNPRVLLHDIHGEIFHPKNNISSISNIGVIPMSWLKKILPYYPSEVIAAILSSFELCQLIKCDAEEKLMFFPALVNCNRPAHLPIQFDFKWELRCTNKFSSFPIQFCHSLLRSLALEFPLEQISNSSQLSEVSRRCFLWKCGIYWLNDDFIKTLVEFSDDFKVVNLSMQWQNEGNREVMKLRSSIIAIIMALYHKHCHSTEVIECIKVDYKGIEYNVCIQDIARVACLKKSGIVDISGRECIPMSSLGINNEPFVSIPIRVLFKMFSDGSFETISQEDFCCIKSIFSRLLVCDMLISYDSLRIAITKLSIFNGRDMILNNVSFLTIIQSLNFGK